MEQVGIESISVSWLDSSSTSEDYRITVDSLNLSILAYNSPQLITDLPPGVHTIRLVILHQHQPSQPIVAGQVNITVRSKMNN